MNHTSFTRWLSPLLYDCLKRAPAIFVNGPRQAGKSTLVRPLTKQPLNAIYMSLDDLSIRSAAESDPLAFIKQFKRPIIIDEVQLVPSLFRAIKLLIDELRQENREQANGRFILTGSANIMALPELADALVGRVRILTLLPLSMGEYIGRKPQINLFFEDKLGSSLSGVYEEFLLEDWIHKATFPEVALMAQGEREGWYQDYLTTILQRDVRQLAEIDKLTALPRLLKILALRVGSLINDASTARDAGLNTMTYRRYRALLQGVFLITTIPPWFRNIGKRLTKSPKLFFYDVGLLAHLLDVTPQYLKASHSPLYGHLVENFVATELMKQLTLLPRITLQHYRTEGGKEVDFVLQGPQGQLIGVEVKSRSTVTTDDFVGLKSFKEVAGNDFKNGIVLYTGKNVLSFGPDMVAIPITALLAG
jgi:predicted AAA+ superfamily ATPase